MSRIVVGFAIDNVLKVLGISRSDLMVRDVQLHFNAERCSERKEDTNTHVRT